MSTTEVTSSKVCLETDRPVDSEDVLMDSLVAQEGFVPIWQQSDRDMEHHVQYQTHLRRFSTMHDSFVHDLSDTLQKPMLQFSVQHQCMPDWQPHYTEIEDCRHWSPISRVSSSSGFDRSSSGYGSMSPEMATAVLASMLDESSMYTSSPVVLPMAYHSVPSTIPTSTAGSYMSQPPFVPSQHFSMKDFQHYPDNEEHGLFDVDDLFEDKVNRQSAPTTFSLGQPIDFNDAQTVNLHTEPDADSVHIKSESERCVPSIGTEHIDQILPEVLDTGSEASIDAAVHRSSSIRSDRITVTAHPTLQPTELKPTSNTKKHARSPSLTVSSSPQSMPKKRRISPSTKSSSLSHSTHTSPAAKQKPALPCPFHHFGCTATFPNKNEWKRHTLAQHLRLGFYRCSLGTCDINHPSGVTKTRGYNDFNRKDLFVQHLRRMHLPRTTASSGSLAVAKRGAGAKKTKNNNNKGRATTVVVGGDNREEQEERWIEEVRRQAWLGVRVAPGGSGRGVGCGFCEERFGRTVAQGGRALKKGEDDDGGGEYDSRSDSESSGLKEEKNEAGVGQVRIIAPRGQPPTAAGGDGKGQGVDIWEQRMEHVAAHYARGAKVEDEALDEDFKEWAVKARLVVQADDGEWVLASPVDATAGADVAALDDTVIVGASGNTAEAQPIVRTGVRRKGKTPRSGQIKSRVAVAAGSINSDASALPGQQGMTTAVSTGRPGSRKSERLFGSRKRCYAEYEDDEASLADEAEEDDTSNKRRKHVLTTVVVAERRLQDFEDDDDDDGAEGSGSDTDTDAAGEDDD